MKRALIYLTYNSEEQVRANFARLVSMAGEVFSIIAIDNASQDATADLLRNIGVVPLVMPENIGFTAAINLGLKLLPDSYEWAIIANPDVAPLEDKWLTKLLSYAPSGCGAIGARLVNGDMVVHGGGQILKEPILSMWRKPYHFGTKVLWVSESLGKTSVGHRVGVADAYMEAEPVPWVTFALVALRMEAVKQVGYLNEEYWLYCSDVDICFRLWDNGWEVWYAPVTFEHEMGASFNKAGEGVWHRGQLDQQRWLAVEDKYIAMYASRQQAGE